jgi:hypothetical protein
MAPRVGTPSIATRAAAMLALAAALAGCGGGGRADVSAHTGLGTNSSTPSTPASCAATVLASLARVAMHVYHEGVASERTAVAVGTITKDTALRAAVEHGDAQATRAAAQALIAAGHMTNLLVSSAGRVLADVGSPYAVAPLRGTIKSAAGAPIASFVTSVWSSEGLLAETNGITQGHTTLRTHAGDVPGSFALPPRRLPPRGTLTEAGVRFGYTSFGARLFPSGSLRVYLARTLRSTEPECGDNEQETVVKTLSREARLIYNGEGGRRALPQVHRVQSDPALLRAVASHDSSATRQAIDRLLNQHIVRLRVSAGGRLLADVGGPFVLAPVGAPLRLGGRTIGRLVLSIQDDEGYLRLAHRLLGVNVLMYMGAQLVKNSLGPSPTAVPASGSYRYRGRSFRVFTFDGEAFPSGVLRIAVLIPIPYS